MSNTFFKFKKFTIHQDKCAMKVCTDSCLFGAIISNKNEGFKNALDIGTGSGLLSLMFAQKQLNCKIDAIEIDENAFNQANDNINQSNYSNNIQIHLGDVKNFIFAKQFDVIFSNPPFYPNDLKSSNDKRNTAMHSSYLSFDELMSVVNSLLNINGKFYILIPYSLESKLISIAHNYNFFVNEIIRIKQAVHLNYFRSILCFSNSNIEQVFDEISIKDETDNYTNEFIALLKDYYLIF